MTTPQLTDEQRLFESAHCGNNRDTVRKNSTTGEYVLPSINDAWAGFQTARALLAQPAAAGQGQAATQEMLDGLLEAAQYLSHRRRVAAAPPAPGGDVPKPLGWIYENSLPGNYPYDAMYPYSAIRHGVRMFPVFAPVAALQSTQGQTASAITSHLKTLESKYMEWCGYGRMPLTEGQFKYLLDKIAAEVTAPTATQGQDAAPAEQAQAVVCCDACSYWPGCSGQCRIDRAKE